MWLGELIAAILVMALGAGAVVFSWGLDYFSQYGPGPGFLPRLLGYGISLCGIVLFAQVLRKRDRSGRFFGPGTVAGAKFLALIIPGFLLFPVLGFSVGLGLLTGLTMRTLGNHGWIQCFVVTAAVIVGIHYVFGDWLTIPIPQGMLGW
jgi:hypothetical protein